MYRYVCPGVQGIFGTTSDCFVLKEVVSYADHPVLPTSVDKEDLVIGQVYFSP